MHRLENVLIHGVVVGEPHFQLGGMDVDVHLFPVHLEQERRERIPVLHHKGFIGVLNGLGDGRILHVAAIDKIILVIAVTPGNHRFADVAGHGHTAALPVHRQQLGGHLPAVDIVNDILQVGVARRLQLRLMVGNEFKGNVRMGKSQPLHEGTDVSRLRHGGLQKFPSGRYIIKQVADEEGGSFRCADLFQALFLPALNAVADAGVAVCRLGDELHLSHRGNTGKCLASKPQGRNMGKIFYFADLAGGMAQKRIRHLVGRNPAAIVRYT